MLFGGGVTSGVGAEVGVGEGVWVCGSTGVGVGVQVEMRVSVAGGISSAGGVWLPANVQAVSTKTVSSIPTAVNSFFDEDESI
jgi:hypothetical protein